MWFDSDTRLFYQISGSRDDENYGVLCPPGQKTRLAYNQGLERAVVILCAGVLTQTDGQPKMFQTLSGLELTNNDRQTELVFPSDYNSDLPETVTQNAFSWLGMDIDQLRQRVLSGTLAGISYKSWALLGALMTRRMLQVRGKPFLLSYL